MSFNLTGRLIAKHFMGLGDKLAQAIASFDPETATEADRDRLQANLREVAIKLEEARTSFNKENQDVVSLKSLIENDEKALEVLAQRLAEGTITEAAVNLFCDELEANKSRLPQEEQEANDAKEYLSQVQQILDGITQQLSEFDAHAKKAAQMLAQAKAQKDLQQMRIDRQAELTGLGSLKSSSSALDALTKKANKLSNEASGLKTVADIQQKPLDQKAELDAIRASVTAPPVMSASDRLKALSPK